MSNFFQLIPQELFVKISLHLNLHDRLQCRLVNSSWSSAINPLLFKTINFVWNDVHAFFALYKGNEDIGNFTQRLEIRQSDLDAGTFMTLPRLFPNLLEVDYQDLCWSGPGPCQGHFSETVQEDKYVEEFAMWNNLSKLKIGFEDLAISISILKSSTFFDLTELDFSFQYIYKQLCRFEVPCLQNRHCITKDFIKNLKNAPNLTSFSLRYCVLNLNDMEDIHASAPNLKEFKVFKMHLCNIDIVEEKVSSAGTDFYTDHIERCSELKMLSLDFYSQNSITMEEKSVLKWLRYISTKYDGLTKLHLSKSYNRRTNLSDHHCLAFEQPLMKILITIPNIRDFRADFCLITETMLETMNDKRIHFENLTITVSPSLESIQQIKRLKISPQSKSIKKLVLLVGAYHPRGDLDAYLLRETDFLNLVDLHLNSHDISPETVITVLKNMPHNLEKLSISGIYFRENRISLPSTTSVTNTKIKHLYLDAVSDGGISSAINSLIELSIESCPYLESYAFHGNFADEVFKEDMKFHFSDEHKFLKYIEISCEGFKYYTFSQIKNRKGLKYLTQNKCVTKLDDIKYGSFVIDLSWPASIDNNLELKLSSVYCCNYW